jgi:archaellum biogenesis ATPase FlaH
VEKLLLSALAKSRSAYERLTGAISSADFSDKGAIIFEAIQSYYEGDKGAKHVDKELLVSSVVRKNHKLEEVVRTVLQEDVSVPNIVKEYVAFRRDRAATELAHALLDPTGRGVDDKLTEYNQWKVQDSIEDDSKVMRGVRLEDLEAGMQPENMIRSGPSPLMDAVGGGLPRESHTLVYAPPEVGKTLMSIYMACACLKNGHKVLYWGNEDPAVNMLMRFYMCLTGQDKFYLLSNIEEGQELAESLGYNNLTFISTEGGTVKQLEAAIKAHQPDIVFVDQIGNFKADGKEGTQALEYISKSVRALAKQYKIAAVSIHQGDAKAQGKIYLDLGDVYYSNVGVQAAMDVMIGLGADSSMLVNNRRMVNLTKNKLTGNHAPFEVLFIPKTGRIMV